MTTTLSPPRHPAKYSDVILDVITPYLPHRGVILDPFAGVGRIHEVTSRAVGLELEYEWAAQGKGATVVGNALHLPFPDASISAICTSPCYGNRMADSHNAKDPCSECRGRSPERIATCPKCKGTGLSLRRTYTHLLGRTLHPDNAGSLQWGPKYQSFHRAAWAESVRVLASSGIFILNTSDHIRKAQLARVSIWHYKTLRQLGIAMTFYKQVKTPRDKGHANGTIRVNYESVAIFRKPA